MSHDDDTCPHLVRANLLEAENARLNAEVERVGAENAHLHKGIYSLSLNVAQLKDEVERLTKAGDAMSDQLLCDYGDNHLTYAWFAAKEGKSQP